MSEYTHTTPHTLLKPLPTAAGRRSAKPPTVHATVK